MNYLDANFATALHFNTRGQTELAERFVQKSSLPFIFGELAELECRRAFILRTARPNSENWTRLQALLADGTWQREPIQWKALFEKAERIIDRHGIRLKVSRRARLTHCMLSKRCSRVAPGSCPSTRIQTPGFSPPVSASKYSRN